MKRTLFFIMLIGISFNAKSQVREVEYPVLSFSKKKENVALWEKKMSENDTVSYKFEFQNEGKEVLEIVSIETSCTCTAPRYTESVKPGEKGFVMLTTTFGQLKSIRSVYAVIKANTKEKFHKLRLEYLKERPQGNL